MADDSPTHGSPTGTSSPRPSWHEREIALALQRLATARERLAVLEERGAATPADAPAGSVQDPADVAKAHQLQADIDALRPKAASRFGGGSARSRIDELEVSLHLVLDRLGFASYDLFVRATDRPASPAVPAVDPDALRFAQREFEDAERSFLEVAAMVIPPNEVDSDADLDQDAAADDGEPERSADILRFKADPAAS